MSFNTIRSLPITDNKENAWKNNVVAGVNARNVIAGTGINLRYGPNGTILEAIIPEATYPVTYAGDYSFNSEYYPNTLVRVLADVEITNQDDEDIPVGEREEGQLPTDTESVIPIATGLFICVAYVPPAAWDETYLNNLIRPQYNGNLPPVTVVNSTRFYDYNVYYPVFPEIPEED